MFDPYHKWLGIPKDQRPPTHYQLLGVSPAEQDPEVIEEAAIRQTTHVRAYQIGQHSAECTQLQKEIARARLTLVNPAKRKAYDEQLVQAGKGQAAPASATADTGDAGIKAGAPQHGGAAPYDAEVLDEPRQDADPALREQKHSAHVKKAGLPIGLFIGLGAGAVILLLMVIGGGAGIWFLRSGPPPRKDGNPIVENKARDGKKPIRDGDEIAKDDLLKKDDATKKDDAAKKDDPKLNKPNIDPDPAKKPVPTVVLKGRVAPELVLELPKDTFEPSLTNDGMRIVYSTPPSFQKGALLFREAPDFAVVHEVTLPGEGAGLIRPTVSSPDGKKMVLIPQRDAVNGNCRVLLWDWHKRAVDATFLTMGRPQRVVLAPDMKHLAAFSVRFVTGAPPEFWVHVHQIGGKQNQVMQSKVDSPANCIGFAPDSGTFLFAPANEQHCRTYSLKTGEFGEMPFARHTLLHAFSTDFSHHAVRESASRLSGSTFDANRVPKSIAASDARMLFAGASFSQDNRYLLIGTHAAEKNLDAALGQLALFNLNNGEVVSASDPALGIPFMVQLGANGMALAHHQQRMTRLYRFPIGPGDTFVKNDLSPRSGSTKIANRSSGKIIGVNGKSRQDGAPLVQWELMNSEPNHLWTLVPADNGWLHIVNVNSGTCLSVDRDASNDGARLVIWKKKDGERAQQWKLEAVVKNDAGWFKIVNRANGKVIGVQGGGMQNGAAVVLTEDGVAAHLLWKIDNPDVVAKLDPAKTKGDPPKSKDDPPVKVVRVAVPDADKSAESEKTIREQFKKEYARKAASDVLALAEKLHKLAGETTDDPVACYVLLREARDLAVKAGRVELAMKVVTDLCAKYELDELGQRVDTLLSFSKLNMTADGYKQFVEIALVHSAGAMMDDHFDESLKVMGAADAVARRSNNASLLAQVQKQDKLIKEAARDHADMKAAQTKLAEDAKDAQANLTVGVYLAFRKGNWEQGLPFLAQGNNAELQELAKKDLAVEDDDKARAEVGDGWWTGAEKKPAFQKAAMQWRAAYWYRQAIPSLKGLPEARASERIKQVDAQPAPFRVAAGADEVDRFKGHKGTVSWLSLSSDGKRLFSSGEDGTVRAWEVSTGKPRVLLGPQVTKGSVSCFAFSPDERQAALLNAAGNLLSINLTTGKSGIGNREAVPGFFWTSNSMVAYTFKDNWHSWDTSKGGESWGAVISGPFKVRGNVRAVVLAPDLDAGAFLCSDESVVTFRMQSNGQRSPQAAIPLNATAGAFPKDAGFVVLGGKDGYLRAFSMTVKANDSAREVGSFKGHSGTIRAVACTPDGKTMISGGDDKTLRIWDVASGKQLQRSAHPGAVTSLVVTPDGRYVISACADSIIRVWSLPK